MPQEFLDLKYERDRAVWDSCARTYEKQIVSGHPDVTAYESFEEDLIDRILTYLIRDRNCRTCLYDVGCGSGRFHLRYGLKMATPGAAHTADAEFLVHHARASNPDYAFDAVLGEGLHSIGGVDCSAEMIALAREKLINAGLGGFLGSRLSFDHGSAFDLQSFPGQPVPVVVTVCNSIGVMQGPSGAAELFNSMRRAVEPAAGIALISAYRKEAVESFALGNYESTMNVCGQPRWVAPDVYAGGGHTLVPKSYKRAYDPSDKIMVDVFGEDGLLIEKCFVLGRTPEGVEYTVRTGHIQTYTDYESYWYSWDQMQDWIDTLWPRGLTYHLEGRRVDALRAFPVQLAILDAGNHLGNFVCRWLS